MAHPGASSAANTGQERKFPRRLSDALSRYGGAACIVLVALLACTPRVLRGISCGHDFDFHLVSWLEALRSWHQGVFDPHWAQTPNWGAGEARFVFYPPLTWMLGAALGSFISWEWVPVTLTFFCLVGTGLSTRLFGRQFLQPAQATLSGCLAIVAPYALFTAYERTAFAELAAAALLPLLLYFALRKMDISPAQTTARESLAYAVPAALVVAAIWLTNAPAGVMACYTLGFVAILAALLERRWWPFFRALVSVPLGLGLAGFYLVPAAWEQRWIAIRQAVDVGMRVSDSWLFARHASPDLEYHDQVLRVASSIVLFTVGLAALAFVFVWKRKNLVSGTRRYWLPLAILVPVLLLLQFPVSEPIWTLLPKLEFLQFPWRWLLILDLPLVIFLAAATPMSSLRARSWSSAIWTLGLLGLTATGALVFFQFCDAEDKVPNQVQTFYAGVGVEGTDEYAPLGSDNALVASGLPDACLVSDPAQELGESDSSSDGPTAPVWFPEQGSCDDTFQASLWQSELKRLDVDSDHAGFVVLRLRRYPAWNVTVNGQPTRDFQYRQDGLLAVPVLEGPSRIEVRWKPTPDVWWGRGISTVSLLVLMLLGAIGQSRSPVRLSS